MRDEIYKQPARALTEFEFNHQVAGVFDDMLKRSIPFYEEIHHMMIEFVDHFYRPGTELVDLGCSTGATLATILERSAAAIEAAIGVDDSEAMLLKARERFSQHASRERVSFQQTDLRHYAFNRPSVVILNYTLQFVRPLYRQGVVNAIYQALTPGGILLMSEKVLEQSTSVSRLFMEMYTRFKLRQGYSDLEISRKREQLENVLIPYKVQEQFELLRQAGFQQAEIFFKWHNFASFIAIKDMQ